MGDVCDDHADLADMYEAGLLTPNHPVRGTAYLSDSPRSRYEPTVMDLFDVIGHEIPAPATGNDPFDVASDNPLDLSNAPKTDGSPDPLRPSARNGSYYLPHPETGKSTRFQRVTNLVKLVDNTYHLELWKQRHVARGMTVRPDLYARAKGLDVKADKAQLNSIAASAIEASGAYVMSAEGTALHKSTEIANITHSLDMVPERHHDKVRLYWDALRIHGLEILPAMMERATASVRYGAAGTFDNIFRLADGSFIMGDLKTGDSLDLSAPSYAGQLAAYEDGVNCHGIFDGRGYDNRIKVRSDFAVIVYLPSTRDEVSVHRIDLNQGHEWNADCVRVRNRQKVKAADVMVPFEAAPAVDTDHEWLEQLNAAHTVAELISVAKRGNYFGQWNERLAGQARLLAAELS